eukprot:353985-Chlamydomonas_euryale.AAC.1
MQRSPRRQGPATEDSPSHPTSATPCLAPARPSRACPCSSAFTPLPLQPRAPMLPPTHPHPTHDTRTCSSDMSCCVDSVTVGDSVPSAPCCGIIMPCRPPGSITAVGPLPPPRPGADAYMACGCCAGECPSAGSAGTFAVPSSTQTTRASSVRHTRVASGSCRNAAISGGGASPLPPPPQREPGAPGAGIEDTPLPPPST